MVFFTALRRNLKRVVYDPFKLKDVEFGRLTAVASSNYLKSINGRERYAKIISVSTKRRNAQ